MNLAIDIGNTAVKWASFERSVLVDDGRWTASGRKQKADIERWKGAERAMICASGDPSAVTAILDKMGIGYTMLGADTPLPIQLDYKTPRTLGADRIAAACGAWALHPCEASLVIDAGTCITVDYIDNGGTYHGGAIMPGMGMSLRALHEYTERLPLVDLDSAVSPRIPGRTTEESILAGTMGATMLALAGYVALYRQRTPQMNVLLTGGDADRLAHAGVNGWQQHPMLTLAGLNAITEHLSNNEE